MRPMPTATELQPLIGEQIGQIWLDPFGVQFKFDRWGLTVEFDIEHIEPDGTRHNYDRKVHDGPPLLLHRLLQKPITSIEREELAFKLNFSDGSILIIHTELGPYECGHLYSLSNAANILIF